MSSFLEKFKGKTNLIGKEGIINSLDKVSLPITKANNKSKEAFTIEKSIKSAVLPSHSSHKQIASLSKPEVKEKNNIIIRDRKGHSFSSQNTKASSAQSEKISQNINGSKHNNLVIKTENDIPNMKIEKKQDNFNKKYTPMSLRTTPLNKQKKRPETFKTELNLKTEEKQTVMEEIKENEEFEEAQRLHLDFLNKVEKFINLDK